MVDYTQKKNNQFLPQELLCLLAEEARLSLRQVVNSCEVAVASQADPSKPILRAKLSAQSALKQLDSYYLGLRMANLGNRILEVEPLAVSSVIMSVRDEIAPLAKAYGVEIELETTPSTLPVIANREILSSALASAGRSLIEAISAGYGQQTLRLSSYNKASKSAVGWYWDSSNNKITNQSLAAAYNGLGSSTQPLPGVSAGQASGVFIADMLLNSLQSRFRASKHNKWTGLVALLAPSDQLALV